MNNIVWHAFIKLNISFDEKYLSPKSIQTFPNFVFNLIFPGHFWLL